MARVLVTGGAGFIGSHLVQALVQRGDKVRVFDNFSTGSAENLSQVAHQIELVAGDLHNRTQVREAVSGVELIFHEAAFVSVPESIENPAECYKANVQGTIEVLEAARKAGVKRIVLASSCAVYGAIPTMPLRESMPPECLSPYAASKQFNEGLAQLYSNAYRLPVVALRYFNVYGPRQRGGPYSGVISKFVSNLAEGKPPVIYGDGTQTRDFTHVSDVVQGSMLALETANLGGEVFNISAGARISINELAQRLSRIMNVDMEPEYAHERPGDIKHSRGDIQKAKKILGFAPKVSIQEGLETVVEWQLNRSSRELPQQPKIVDTSR